MLYVCYLIVFLDKYKENVNSKDFPCNVNFFFNRNAFVIYFFIIVLHAVNKNTKLFVFAINVNLKVKKQNIKSNSDYIHQMLTLRYKRHKKQLSFI